MTNITIKSAAYDGRYLQLHCEQTIDISSNSSIVKWTLSSVGGSVPNYSTGPTTVTINGTKVKEYKRVSYTTRQFPAAIGSTSGTIKVPHNADGSKAISISLSTAIYNTTVKTSSATWTLDNIPRGVGITSAPDFTDEESPTIHYNNHLGANANIQAAISLTGERPDIAYRPIDPNANSYTFELTDAEKEILYAATNEGKTYRTVYFYIKTTIGDDVYYRNSGPRTFTIVDCEPDFELSIQEADEFVLEHGLTTGYPNSFIATASDIAYRINPILKKGATVKECFFGIGSDYEYGAASGQFSRELSGTLENIEDNYYEAVLIDSRGQKVYKFDKFHLIYYFAPTVSLDASIEVVEETEAKATLSVKGTVFLDSLGNEDNQFRLDYRYKTNNGEFGDWVVGQTAPSIFYDEYSATIEVGGLYYLNSYVFQVRIVDALKTVESHNSKVLNIFPLFDWGSDNFNFNIPLIIQGNPLADYVIETGTAAMGSNGTWYWSKWKSGKAECYGIRNYGNMAVSTAFGQIYESAKFEQDLPSGLFAAHPTVMIGVEQSNLGCWIERAPGETQTEDSTGGFYVCRAKSNNLSQIHLSFQCVGRWK